MTQGNPFGNKGGRWMPAARLRLLARNGRTYDEIAEANFRAEGWKPSRSAVLRKLESLGIERRYASHTDLLPWNVQPEHDTALLRHMLQAESRRRQGMKLSRADKVLAGRLDELLFGRGTPMVVTYSPETGFALVVREDTDDENSIIRADGAAPKRKEIRAALRKQIEEENDPETAARIIDALETSQDGDGRDEISPPAVNGGHG